MFQKIKKLRVVQKLRARLNRGRIEHEVSLLKGKALDFVYDRNLQELHIIDNKDNTSIYFDVNEYEFYYYLYASVRKNVTIYNHYLKVQT